MSWSDKYVTADSDGGDGSSGNPWTLAEAIDGVAAGDRVNVKAGTYANTTSNLAFATPGTTTAPIWWRGYKTSIGDQDAVANATKITDVPLITFTTGQFAITGAYQTFSNLVVESACTSPGGAVYPQQTNIHFYRCRITNSAANPAARALTGSTAATVLKVVACHLEATTTATNAVSLGGLCSYLLGCSIRGGSDGINFPSSGWLASFCLFDGQADDCITTSEEGVLSNCSFYAPGGNGINITTAQGILIANCYFEDVDTANKAAINQTSGTDSNLILCVNNAFYNCTANYDGITEGFVIYDQGTLASAAFTNPASDDFTVGAVAKAIGFPGAFEGLSSCIGYMDVGALQRSETVDEAARNTDPSEENVKDGVTYKIANVAKEGTLEISGLSETQMEAILDARGLTEPASDTADSVARRGASEVTLSDVGSGGGAMHSTTIATLASQTSFTLTAGSADDDAYAYCVVVVTDESTATQKCVGVISDYTGATKTVTLGADPAIFTMAVGDAIEIYPPSALRWINGAVASGSSTVDANVVSMSDKTGFKLASDGLDAIATTAPSGPATTFREMVVQTWRWFFKRATKTSESLVTYADDGTTPITTQAITASGTDEERGAAT